MKRGPNAAQPDVRTAAKAFGTWARANKLRSKDIARMLNTTPHRSEQLRCGRYGPKAHEIALMDPDDAASYLATVRYSMQIAGSDPPLGRDRPTEQFRYPARLL